MTGLSPPTRFLTRFWNPTSHNTPPPHAPSGHTIPFTPTQMLPLILTRTGSKEKPHRETVPFTHVIYKRWKTVQRPMHPYSGLYSVPSVSTYFTSLLYTTARTYAQVNPHTGHLQNKIPHGPRTPLHTLPGPPRRHHPATRKYHHILPPTRYMPHMHWSPHTSLSFPTGITVTPVIH